MKSKAIFLFLFLLSSVVSTHSQDRSAYFVFGEPYKASVVGMPHNSTDSMVAIVMFRISYETLQFTKTSIAGETTYSAQSEVNIAFRDSTGIVRNRSQWIDTITSYDFAETTQKTKWAEGAISVTLPLHKYSVELEYDTKSRYRKNKITSVLSTPKGFDMANGDASFIFSSQTDNPQFSVDPFIADDMILFNPEGALINAITATADVEPQYLFLCESIAPSGEANDPSEEPNENNKLVFSGKADYFENMSLELALDRKKVILSKMDQTVSDYTILNFSIEFPANKLKPGSYIIKIFDEKGNDTIQKEFVVNWEDIPQSLEKTDGAVEYMYYILDDQTYDAMASLDGAELQSTFEKYWEERDPTPNTPFNEAAYQYFSRVDYSYFNYRTIVEKDGAKTDRGKIFILYGSPDTKDELFEGEESIIKWQYSKLRKEFIFTAVTTGVYRLTKINEI